MKIEIDSKADSPKELRAAAALCLMLAGDIAVPDVSESDVSVREMIAPPNPMPGSIVRKGEPGPHPLDAPANVLPFPTAPPAPSAAAPTVLSSNAPPFPANMPPSPFTAGVTPVAPLSNETSAQHPPNLPQQPNFSVPPIPSPANIAVPAPVSTASIVTAAAASNAASASPTGAVEYDKSGLPWDARIHNKGRTKKKDGTWKLQKGLDSTFAQAIVQELIAKKALPTPPLAPLPSFTPPPTIPAPLPPTGGPLTPEQEARAAFAGAPPAPQVPLPPAMPYQYPMAGAPVSTLPVPPFPGSAGAPMVPPPPVAAPVPPAPQPGAVGGGNTSVSAYKQLIDKLTAATQNKTLNPALVAPTVQRFGVPNMGVLSDPSYANLLPAINQEFDRLIAGGAPSGP